MPISRQSADISRWKRQSILVTASIQLVVCAWGFELFKHTVHIHFGRFRKLANVLFWVRFQSVAATHWLNLSAGVSYSRVFRGRSLRDLATAFNLAWLWTDRSVPFGKYWRSNLLVFSLLPLCHGLCGSQKNTSILVFKVKRLALKRLSISHLNMRAKDTNPDISDILPSIREHGVHQTLLVRPEGESPEIQTINFPFHTGLAITLRDGRCQKFNNGWTT